VAQTDFYPSPGSRINHRYEVTDIAGSGNTAIVLACYDRKTKKKVAVKRFFPQNMTAKLENKIRAEPALKVKSEFVIKGEEAFDSNGFLHLAMPFAEGRSLRDVIDLDNGFGLDEVHAVYTALCLTRAAEDLHAAGVVSTDIKPDNVIVSPDGRARLIDITCFEMPGVRAEVSLGTFPYAARELVNQDVLYPSTDVYSVGVVLCEMLMEPDYFAAMDGSWELSLGWGIKPDISYVKQAYPCAGRIIDRAIKPVPGERYSNASELLGELMTYYNTLTGYSSPTEKRLVLVCLSGKTLSIGPGKIIVGRKHIDPANLFVSEEHIEVNYDGASNINVRDVGSRNGTTVNGNRIGSGWVSLTEKGLCHESNNHDTECRFAYGKGSYPSGLKEYRVEPDSGAFNEIHVFLAEI
jgi:serine/threonine protein kinase